MQKLRLEIVSTKISKIQTAIRLVKECPNLSSHMTHRIQSLHVLAPSLRTRPLLSSPCNCSLVHSGLRCSLALLPLKQQFQFKLSVCGIDTEDGSLLAGNASIRIDIE